MADTLRVLYVDDEQDLLEIGRVFLEQSGDFFVTTLGSASEALELLVNEKFDAIISDYQMPGMDGIQLLIEVREKFGSIPFILFTGRGREEVVMQAINSGVDFYLQKGGDPGAQFAELSHKVRQATSRKRADDALKSSEEKYRHLVELVKVGIWAIDAENNTTYVNPQMAEMLQYTVDEMQGLPLTSFMDDAGKMIFVEKMERRRQGITEVHPFEFITKGGSRIYVTISTSPLTNDKGVYLGATAVISDITERKRTEVILAEREELFRSVVYNSSDLTILTDAKNRITYASPQCERVLGYPADEFRGKIIPEIIHPDDIARCRETWEQVAHQGLVLHEFEYRIIDGQGAIRWISHSASQTTANERVLGMQNTIRDITGRKRVEEELRESEERHRILLNDFPDPLFSFYPDGTYRHVNQAFATGIGKSIDQIIGKKIWDVFQKDEAEKRFSALRTVFSTGEGKEIEVQIPHPDGDRIYVTAIIPVKDISGSVVSVICSSKDITERKLAEKALQENGEKYRAIFDESVAAVYVFDEKKNFINSNQAGLDLLGYSWEELLHMSIPDVDADPVVVLPAHQELLSGGRLINYEHRLRRKDETIITVINNSSPLTDPQGNVVGMISTLIDITGRKHAEETLHLFEDLVEHSSDAIGMSTPNGRHYYQNESFSRMFGIIGDCPPDTLYVDKTTGKQVFDTIMGGGNWQGEVKMFKSDRTILDIFLRTYAIRDQDGRIIGLVGLHTDITERRLSENTLIESERFNRGLVENLPDYIVIYEPDGKILYVNPASADVMGYDAGMLVGKSLLLYVAEEHRNDLVSRMTKYREGDDVPPYEIDILNRDGCRRSVIVNGTSIQYHNSPATLLVLTDITERKQVEEALRESEERFREIFENAIDAITVLGFTPDGMPSHFTEVNMNACMISGYTREEMLTLSPKDLDDPGEWNEAVGYTQKIMEPGYLVFERILVRKDGEKIPIEISTHVFTLNNQKVMLSLFRDITERKQAEDVIRQVNRKLSLLSSITRHDINNQMTVLMGFLTILKKKQTDPTFNEYFVKVSTAAKRIAAMIQFTKEYEEIGVHAPTWQDCRTLVDTAAKQAPLRKVEVKNDLPAGAEVFADPLVVKVCYNLMDNAVRYGGKITTIRFSVLESGDDYLIVCEDDGDGVVAAEKEKIFERGFGKNTGLGLALSREILLITGIKITETGEPGKGARFEMTVPKGAWRMTETDRGKN